MAASKTRSGKKVYVQGSLNHSLEITRTRLVFVCFMIMLCFGGIGVRLIDLAIDGMRVESSHLTYRPASTEVKFKRHDIVDRNGVLLATNLKTASLYANPRVLLNKGKAVSELRKIFPEISAEWLAKKFNQDRSFVWIKRHLHPNQQYAVNALGIPGLYFHDEEKRVYPHGSTTAHILGTVDIDGNGVSGIEKSFNKNLLSEDNQDALQLSLDIRVQSMMHQQLQEAMKKHSAQGAAGIVMDSKTGEVVAMVSLPDFDPNLSKTINKGNMFNRATLGVYEMGSVFKTFSVAAALDSNSVEVFDKFDATDPLRMGRFIIRDFHPEKRPLAVPELLIYSSNIGMAKMMDEVGGEVQQRFLEKLGMFEPLKIELFEVGDPIVPNRWGRLTTMTASYGHGLAVSPLHVAAAQSAMVNGGMLYQPTLLVRDEAPAGERVMRKETSDMMRKLLRLVKAESKQKTPETDGYMVGGKTGTAEKAVGRGYQTKQLLSSYVASFPMQDPRYVVMATLDEPKGTKETFGYATGGWTAAPVVRNVIAGMAPLNKILPVDENSEEIQKVMFVDYQKGGNRVARH